MPEEGIRSPSDSRQFKAFKLKRNAEWSRRVRVFWPKDYAAGAAHWLREPATCDSSREEQNVFDDGEEAIY